eukprot:GEMP01001341.1.p1 GENE.GEMP01001341.1~~GEMP01001341.1.p1  ORF type:complete len:1098 (+),score=216.04 GEMP01001341.1:567-3860(+)
MTDRWTCSRCLFANNELLPFCEVCDAQRSPSVEAELRRKSTKSAVSDMDAATAWKCGKCTFLNDLALDICEVCDTLQVESGWKCSRCTLFNAIELQICMACDYGKDGANADVPESKARGCFSWTGRGDNFVPNDANAQQISDSENEIDAARGELNDPNRYLPSTQRAFDGKYLEDPLERCRSDEKPDSLKQAFAMWEDAENGDAEVHADRDKAPPPEVDVSAQWQTDRERITSAGAPCALDSNNNVQQRAVPDSTLFAGFVSRGGSNMPSVYFRSKPPGGSKYPLINCRYDSTIADDLVVTRGEVMVKSASNNCSSPLESEDVVISHNMNRALEDEKSTLKSALLKPEEMGRDFLFMVKDARSKRVADVVKTRQGSVSANNNINIADHCAEGKGLHWVDGVKSPVVGANCDGVFRNGELSVAPAAECQLYQAERPKNGKGIISIATRDAERPSLPATHCPLIAKGGKKDAGKLLGEEQHPYPVRNATAKGGPHASIMDGSTNGKNSTSVLHHLFAGHNNESLPMHQFAAGAKGGNVPPAMLARATMYDPARGAVNPLVEQLSSYGANRDDSMGTSILQLLQSGDTSSAHQSVQGKGGNINMEDNSSTLLKHFLNGKASKGPHAVNGGRMSPIVAKGVHGKKQIDTTPSQSSEPSKGSGNDAHRSGECNGHKGAKGLYDNRQGSTTVFQPNARHGKGNGSASDNHNAASVPSIHPFDGRGKGVQLKKSAEKGEHAHQSQQRPPNDKNASPASPAPHYHNFTRHTHATENGLITAMQHLQSGKTPQHTDGADGEQIRPSTQPRNNYVPMFPLDVSTHGKGAIFNKNGMYVNNQPNGMMPVDPMNYMAYGQFHQGHYVPCMFPNNDNHFNTNHKTDDTPDGRPKMKVSLTDTLENQRALAIATAVPLKNVISSSATSSLPSHSKSHDTTAAVAKKSRRQSAVNGPALISSDNDKEDAEWCAAVDQFQREALNDRCKLGALSTAATLPTVPEPKHPSVANMNCHDAVGEDAWRDMMEEREEDKDHLKNLDWLFDHFDHVDDLAPVPTIPKPSLQAAGYTSAWLTKGPDCPPSADDPVFGPPTGARTYTDCPYLVPVDIEAD